MEGWLIDTVKVLVPAAFAGVGGLWGHWTWTRNKQKEADLREEQRQAEYDEFKKKRRLVGAGEVEKMERADKLTDLIIKLKTNQITRDEFTAYRDDLIAGRKVREPKERLPKINLTKMYPVGETASVGHVGNLQQNVITEDEFVKRADFDNWLSEEQRRLIARHLLAVLMEHGPNDYPVGFDEHGNKVEWQPEDDTEGGDSHLPTPMILLRREAEIHEAAEEFFEKVWWNRHQMVMDLHNSGKHPLTPEILKTATERAKEIENKYGRDNLIWDDFEWGMVNGKLSALRWVGGSEWDFLDT